MESAKTSISIPRPFGLKATALGHGWHECAPMSWCEGGGCLQIIERDGVIPVRLSLTEGPRRGRNARVNIAVEAHKVSDRLVALMRERTRTMLRADVDMSGFYELAATRDDIAPVAQIGAGRILRSADMTENIIKTICATNVNWVQAVKMINRIGQLGPHIHHHRSQNAWPTPREILAAGEDYLLNIARVGYRAEPILALCRSVLDGSFDVAGLDAFAESATTDELYAHMCSIKGIGPASAGFLLGQLGHHERLSIDSWTITYVGNKYMNGRKPTVKQIEKRYQPYGRWRNLVWWFEQWLEWDTAQSILRIGQPLN